MGFFFQGDCYRCNRYSFWFSSSLLIRSTITLSVPSCLQILPILFVYYFFHFTLVTSSLLVDVRRSGNPPLEAKPFRAPWGLIPILLCNQCKRLSGWLRPIILHNYERRRLAYWINKSIKRLSEYKNIDTNRLLNLKHRISSRVSNSFTLGTVLKRMLRSVKNFSSRLLLSKLCGLCMCVPVI